MLARARQETPPPGISLSRSFGRSCIGLRARSQETRAARDSRTRCMRSCMACVNPEGDSQVALRLFSRSKQTHHVAPRDPFAAARRPDSPLAPHRAARRRCRRRFGGWKRRGKKRSCRSPARSGTAKVSGDAASHADPVLDALAPRDRLRLAYYYVEELTLAEIGKLLGEHEATVSRKLERTESDFGPNRRGPPREEVERRAVAALLRVRAPGMAVRSDAALAPFRARDWGGGNVKVLGGVQDFWFPAF